MCRESEGSERQEESEESGTPLSKAETRSDRVRQVRAATQKPTILLTLVRGRRGCRCRFRPDRLGQSFIHASLLSEQLTESGFVVVVGAVAVAIARSGCLLDKARRGGAERRTTDVHDAIQNVGGCY